MAMHIQLQLHAIFLLVFLAYCACSYEQEDYWKTKLPKVPMPEIVKDDLLHSNGKEKAESTIEPFTFRTNEKKASSDKPYKYLYDYFYYNAENGDTKKASLSKPYKYLYDYFYYNAENNGEMKEASPNKPYKYLYDYFYYNAENGDQMKKASSNKPYKYLYDYFFYNAENGDQMKKAGSNKPYKYLYDYFYYNAENGDQMKKVGSNKPYKYLYDYFSYKADNGDTKANRMTFKTKPDEKDSKETLPVHPNSLHHHHPHHFMHNDNNVNTDEFSSTTSPSDTLFFIEKNLQVGMKLPQDFQKIQTRPILPKHIVQSFPFAYENFTDILSLFSIKSESEDATDIKDTLHLCFKRPKGIEENSTCAQSIEEVVDFVVRELGTNEVEVKTMDRKMDVPNGRQDYVIKKVKKLDVPGNNAAVCHRIRYPYTVYYCHHQLGIGHYDVTLVSLAGTVVQTTAICHYDTYAWNPKSPVLRALGLKPGDSPLCHFASLNDMFWNLKPDVSKSLDMAQ